MIKQTHIVIDLETLGKGPNAPIAAIGAVVVRDAKPLDEFYRRIDLESAMIPHWKREADASTIQWWLQQSAEARAEIDGSQPGTPIISTLEQLAGWMDIYAPHRDALVWGNGSSFDNVILRSAYSELTRPTPWEFRNDRDLRTILALYPEAKNVGPFEGTKHHALHDARHEAKQLCKALRLHAGQSESSSVLSDLLHQAADVLTNPDADMFERLQLARNIQGELENNPLQPQVEREEVSHG
ncbi:hypothetical protein OF001_U20040 [Pseudomonas sp. OF001]|uniref:3'-5' exonuclease n=1 Tax=Pseudomonas sp. OF001 TaxID=2772300 RepID=UPI00191AD5B0|nr:3'-5' exonuclease [Pseudomonas sp. OF001]CAD5377113.1 hypothetical protein OF001_U20040 [Pseudomonas sp. OF001]